MPSTKDQSAAAAVVAVELTALELPTKLNIFDRQAPNHDLTLKKNTQQFTICLHNAPKLSHFP